MLDYVTIAQGRLTNQFSEKPLINGLVAAMVAPIETVENDADDVKNKRWIDTAEGKQLDGAGYIVGEFRQGRGDEEYRDAIKFRIFVNTSNATPEDLIKGLRFLTKPDDIQYMEQYPATAIMFTNGPVVPPEIHYVIQSLAPAAISDVQILVSFAHQYPFRFSRETLPGELFVNSNEDYLTAGGDDVQVTISQAASGSRLGGIAPADLDVGGFMLDVGGPTLAINSPNFDTIIESDSHLVGVYT